MWDLSFVLAKESEPLPAGLADPRPGIWVSFAPAAAVEANLAALTRFEQHRLVALPKHPWEALKIGGGTPPIRIERVGSSFTTASRAPMLAVSMSSRRCATARGRSSSMRMT